MTDISSLSPRRMRTVMLALFTALALVASLGAQFVASRADAAAKTSATQGAFIYGIDDSNRIWEIDPVNQTFQEVNDTQLARQQGSNSFAYDSERDQFFFAYGPDSDPDLSNKLLEWDRTGTGLGSLVPVESGMEPADANATYWNNSYWTLSKGNARAKGFKLTQVEMTYNKSNEITKSTKTVYDLRDYAGSVADGTKYPGDLVYGDIAAAPDGTLYGSATNGVFFTIDLTKLGDKSNSVYQLVSTGAAPVNGMQLSFNADYSTLYGHAWRTGEWYTVDVKTGAAKELGFRTQVPGTENGFRDLGGAADTPATPGLLVKKNASPQEFTEAGQPVAFTVTATNTGQTTLTDVSVTDPMVQLTCDPDTTGLVLQPGQTVTCTGMYTVTKDDVKKGIISNTASAQGTPPSGTPLQSEDTASVTGPEAPELSIVKTLTSDTPVRVGDRVRFDLDVKNRGTAAAFSVDVIDNLPDNLQYVGYDGGDRWKCDKPFANDARNNGRMVECVLRGRLGAGEKAPNLTIITEAIEDGDGVVNSAVVEGEHCDGGTVRDSDKEKFDILKLAQRAPIEIDREPGTTIITPDKTNAGKPVKIKANCGKPHNDFEHDSRECKGHKTADGGYEITNKTADPIKVEVLLEAPETGKYEPMDKEIKVKVSGNPNKK